MNVLQFATILRFYEMDLPSGFADAIPELKQILTAFFGEVVRMITPRHTGKVLVAAAVHNSAE